MQNKYGLFLFFLFHQNKAITAQIIIPSNNEVFYENIKMINNRTEFYACSEVLSAYKDYENLTNTYIKLSENIVIFLKQMTILPSDTELNTLKSMQKKRIIIFDQIRQIKN